MMKHIYIVAINLLFFQSLSTAQVVPDLPILIEFFHPEGYRDTVVLGLSLNANEGYDDGLDIIDTTEMEFPLDVRIYDPLVEEQFQFNKSHNLKHSYMAIPNVPRGEVRFFEREFLVVMKTDSINFDRNTSLGECTNEYNNLGPSSTYFKINAKSIANFFENNSEGWRILRINIYSGGIYFGGGVDLNELAFNISSMQDLCYSMSSFDNIPNEIFLVFTIKVFNDLYVDLPKSIYSQSIHLFNNMLTISNINIKHNIIIFDISGRMVYKKNGIIDNFYQIDLTFNNSSVFFLNVFDENNQVIAIKKFFFTNNY